MLVSLSKRFIFVANLKTASTSIESVLRPYAEFQFLESNCGKHFSLRDLEVEFSSIFKFVPRSEFRVIGTMREPFDWLSSLYRSHKSVRFEHTPLSTVNMTPDDFLAEWCLKNVDQTASQYERFINLYGVFCCDYLMRFDNIEEDFRSVCDFLEISCEKIPNFNVSVDMPCDFTADSARIVRERYAQDFNFYAHATSRVLSGEIIDYRSATMFENARSEWPAPEGTNEAPANILERPLTTDDVIWAYRLLLGREPETDSVIYEHLQASNREELRKRLIDSDEFARELSRLRLAERSGLTLPLGPNPV